MPDRPPPDRDRGTPRPMGQRAARYVASASQVDRRERHGHRRRTVLRTVARRSRRRWALVATGWVAATAALAAGGWVVAGAWGALAGVGAAVVSAVGQVALRWLARRRGAAAWDWQTQSYRLITRPADRVRALDRERQRPPWQPALRRDPGPRTTEDDL